MDSISISIILKIVTWVGGVLISIWIIKLLREINSKQKEYISLIEKSFAEREKTRDQKIEFLDKSYKREIELIEKEKSIFFKTLEIEKETIEEKQTKQIHPENFNFQSLILDIKADLSLVISKLSSLSIEKEDLIYVKEIVNIASDINKRTNSIANKYFELNDKIDLRDFILETYNSIYSLYPFKIIIEDSLLKLKPILFDKGLLLQIVAEIFINSYKHSFNEYLRVYGAEYETHTILYFENSIRFNKAKLNRVGGLEMIKKIMDITNNDLTESINGDKFIVALKFKKDYIA